MSTKRACFHLLFIFVFVFNFVATVGPSGVAPASAMAPGGILAPMEDLVGWAHHVELNVRNNAATLLPAGYTTGYVLDTASLISGSQLKPDCSDLRVTYGTDPAETELDRLVEGCNTAATTVKFRTQADIPVGEDDHQYRLYYGNQDAGAAPADPRNVYTFFDDFQDGDAAGWNAAKGTWGVVDDGGNFVYRYTSGGANWAISYPSVSNVANLEILGKMRAAASTTWIGLAFRIQDANNFLTFYESRDGSLMKYARVVGDDHGTPPATAGSSMAADTWYNLRIQAVGSQVRARFWQSGSAEPAAWLIQYTDTTFQTQSNFGATLYNHTTNADWDDIQVRKLVDAEPAVEVYVPTPPITDWYYRAPINVTNTSASATLPVKYTAELVLDTSALIDSGRMLATCEDLKVGSVQGTDVFEIDRVVDRCNSASTRVWFALQRPILPGANDAGYYLYYGDPSPQPPLANEVNVFIFYEDWEKGTSHWTNAGGLDPANTGTMGHSVISDLDWISPLNSQQFPVKAAGGDAFSGYIPVAPNTTYTLGVWARSGENTYAPVGIDPYTAAYGRGNEQWLWTNEWTIGPAWSWRSAQFTTLADTAFVKIKSEWWGEAPGIQPVYMDNLFLRYTIASEPALSLGEEETTLVLPVIANILDDGPVNLGDPVTISADISTAEGEIDSATLRIVSPVSVDVSTNLVSGSNTDGTWQGNYTPLQGGVFSYRILAHATTDRQTSSPLHTFSVIDSTPPVITQLTFINPVLVNSTQTVSVNVTDNGVVSSVSLTVGGAAHPMTQNGSQYSYAWQVSTVGDIPFTVTATDSASNQSQLAGSFTSQAREVDVCTWKGCKPAAASWSNDDSNNACKDVVETAGFRGTYYVNGASPQPWYTDYSAAGHEIGAHTVEHPCNGACCGSTCTPETIWQCPYTETEVAAYRTDQFDPNVAAIETSTGVPVLSGAWPCGCTDAGRMTAAQFYFLGVRGYNDCGCNWVQDNNAPTPIMFMNLNGLHAYDQSFIDRAIADGTWTIVTSHGSCDGISYMGSRQDVLWLPTVGEGLKYIKVRNAAQFSNYSRVGRTIAFDAVHNLAMITRQQYDGTALLPIAFDNPVSLKVHILDTDNVLSVLVNGVPASYQIKTLDGTRYIVFDTTLDTTRHVVVNLTAPAPTIGLVTDNGPVELGGQAEVDAIVTVSEGTIESVNLEVLTPAVATYEMTLVGGTTDTYTASFTPGAIGDYTYRVTAANEGGAISQSAVRTLHVQDTTHPAWRSQTQLFDRIPVGGANTLSAEGQDIGGLGWATLSTNESGAWQEFTWPVSDWWDHAWAHRVPVVLTESSGLSRSAETVDLLISSDQLTGLADCDAELRVAGSDRLEVPVQVYGESSQGGTLTCHLLFQADLAANSSRTYYVYYGNPMALPPVYTTDLTSSLAGGLVTLHNSFFDLNLDEDGGVVSRLRLPQGSNTSLPLSPEANAYWGWHQVCSTIGGNITGKNQLCAGGIDPASGLSLAATLDGPVVKEYTFTSVKGAVTYTIIYRFYANSPHYEYHLTPSGGSASVMNNFWYSNGYFTRLGTGTGGTPSTTFNTYSSGADQVRMATFTTVSVASIDGSDNDGTDLGGIEYLQPNAPDLDLWVTTGATQNDTEAALDRLAQPVAFALGTLEDAPASQYGSPLDMHEATSWAPAAFTWQNPTIPSGTHIQWRIKFCDLTDHCTSTDVMEFATNAAPTAHDDSYLTNEDIPLAIAAPGVLSNDSDPESNTLTAILVAGPAHGTLTLNPDGSFVYTPGLNYHGADSFTYTASDGELDSNVAVVSITVTPVNDPPSAADQSVTTPEEAPRSITLTGSDVDGDPLAFTVVDPPTHGTLSGNAPDLLYTPEINYHGPDGFTYKASDGELDSNVATVSITINPVNDAPVAVDDSEATAEDTALVMAADTLKINDTDADNSNAELSVIAVSSPVNGVVTLEDGTITFTPDVNFVGTAGFDYTVSDGFLTDSGHVTVAVGTANDAPVITGQETLSTAEDTSLTISLDDLTVTDPDNVYPDDFSLTVLGGSNYAVLDATTTPAADFNGMLTVPVFVNDGAADSNTFNLTVSVDAVNDAPVADDQSLTTAEDTPLPITLSGTDADGDPLTFSVLDPPAHGTLSGTAPHLTYTPSLNYHGPDSFTYQANDGELDSIVAMVSVTVDAVNDPPTAADQSLSTAEDTPLPITLSGTDADGDPLTFSVVDPPAHGTLSGAAPHLTYTPSLNYHGSDSFTFKANDGTLDSNVATASLTVTPVDDPPVALDEGYTAGFETPLTVPAPGVLGNDTDVDSAGLTALLVTGPAHGVIILNADGSFTYTPSAGYSGADSFTYTAGDGTSSSSPATVALTILPPDLIFADGFESGGLGAWSGSVTDGGDLSVTDAAALVGSKGLLALVDDTQPVYVRDDSPSGESRYRARFYFDPNSIIMAPGDNHYILYAYSGNTEVIMLQLAFNGASYQLRGVVRNDASNWQFTPYSLLSDQPHFVEIEWRASSAPGASDGGLWLWLDGTAVGSRTGVDNDTRRIDTVRLGAVYGLDTGTHGSYSFDAFESRRETYIGIGHILADFSGIPTSGTAPLQVSFTNLSQGPGELTYLWDFGDGATSSAVNPTHVYPADGSYTVSLTASGTEDSQTRTRSGYIQVSDLIFADGFESGGLGAWSGSVTDGGDLSVTEAAALVGSKGMLALVDDTQPVYVRDDSPSGESRYRARFYFDPNSIIMAPGDNHYILYAYSGSTEVIMLQLAFNGASYQLRGVVRNDASSWLFTPYSLLSDQPHFMEIEWRASSAPGASDGGLWLWLDGTAVGSRTGVDNDTRRIDTVRLGAVYGLDTGTHGSYSFDAFESRRLNPIGGAVANFSATPTAGVVSLAVQFSDLSKASQPVTAYAWDFGDGATSTEANPRHTYTAEGTYTVRLEVTAGAHQQALVRDGYITVLPYTDLIFADGFESGGLGAWSGSVTDGGDLSVTDAAALVGSKGMLALVDDTQPVYVRDDSPSGESRYRARFYFDPNSIVMAPGDNHYILYAYSGSTEVIMLQLAFNGASYQLRGVVRNDASNWQFTPYSLLSDQPHFVEIEWRASSAPGASDGGLWLWLDGTAVGSRTGVDNDTRRIDTLRLGAVYGLDTGTHGSYSFDAFESRRETYIGP